MTIPLTWTGLRGDRDRHGWYRHSDLIDAAAAVGVRFTQWEVRKALRGLPKPTERKYGHLHYRQEHVDAVVRAARIRLDDLQATGVP